MLSVLCVYNNKDVLNSMLITSLSNQSTKYELLCADNTDKKYSSASEALNDLVRASTGNHAVIVHQDVAFSDPLFLERLESDLNSLGAYGVAGVAGVGPDSGGIRSVITQGSDRTKVGLIIDRPTEVQTIDEVMFCIRKSLLNQELFDTELCDNWHLYSVEYCLRAASLGLRNYVLPYSVYHLSTGVTNAGYFVSLKKVLSKYRKQCKCVFTTMGDWSTYCPTYTIARWHVMRKIRSLPGVSFFSKIKHTFKGNQL